MQRLKVFIDYQNVYRLARRAFVGANAPASHGQVHPSPLGVLLETRRNALYEGTPFECELTEVRVYRGMPDGALDPKGHGAAFRQIAQWERHPRVRVLTHPVAYPRGWANVQDRPRLLRRGDKPREKGIDVQLAVDLVLGAVQDDYDVAIVLSGDSDLLPAIRATFLVDKHVEVAAWAPRGRRGTRIPARDIPPLADGSSRSLWCHFLTEADFSLVRDDTRYSGLYPT